MEVTLGKNLTAADIPPYSYTGIAHTFRMSPFNEYQYAMARLRWFTNSFDPGADVGGPDDRLAVLRAKLGERADLHGHFTYLHVSDAGFVDDTLDGIYRLVSGGDERGAARVLGPLEPGLGHWVNDDPFNELYSVELLPEVSREELFGLVAQRLEKQHPEHAFFDDIYLYPPDYGQVPGGPVKHTFRIFGHADAGDAASAGRRLGQAAEIALRRITASLTVR